MFEMMRTCRKMQIGVKIDRHRQKWSKSSFFGVFCIFERFQMTQHKNAPDTSESIFQELSKSAKNSEIGTKLFSPHQKMCDF